MPAVLAPPGLQPEPGPINGRRPPEPPGSVMPQPAPAGQEAAPRVDKTRARVVTAALALPAAMALALSASTSYRFAGDKLGITNLHERVMLCATVETAVIALTLHAWGARSKASAWLAYGLVAVQSIPAFEVSGGAGGVFRIAAGPVLLAVLLHKLLGLETKFSGTTSTGLLASTGREIRERLTAKLGIGRRGADSAAIARSRAADRAVKLASARRLNRRSAARLASAIDTARHGLSDADAATAEASIVARVVRRRSVADLHSLDIRHVWTTTGTSADGQSATTTPATATTGHARPPAVWAPTGTVIGGPARPRRVRPGPRTHRRPAGRGTGQANQMADAITQALATATRAAPPAAQIGGASRPRRVRPARRFPQVIGRIGGHGPATDTPHRATSGGHTPGHGAPAKTTPARTGSGQAKDTGVRVAAYAAKHPDMTTSAMAAALSVSDRTIRRYRNTA